MSGRNDAQLTTSRKVGFALGDHTITLAQSALALVYLFFLTEVAGLRADLAGLVVWVARAVDAFTDPAMGHVSDRMTWKVGRRRPFFLIGAIPFGVAFALLWWIPADSQATKFLYYTAVSIGLSLSMTILAVPYFALLPEMARSDQERSSLNAYRTAAAVVGTLAAVGLQPLAAHLGGPDDSGYLKAGVVFACWLAVPWLIVFRVASEELPVERSPLGVFASLGLVARHRYYRVLAGLYVMGRIAIDVTGAVLLFYFTHWLGRPDDFAPTLVVLFGAVILSLPLWLVLAKRLEKKAIFVLGASIWIVAVVPLALAGSTWPRWSIFSLAALIGIGYAVVDFMPWAMLGDVVDEGEVMNGSRREGLYAGVFTFLRKLGGATGVAFVGFGLSVAGYVPGSSQGPVTLVAVRAIATALPAAFLAIAITLAWRYRVTRSAQARIRLDLAAAKKPVRELR